MSDAPAFAAQNACEMELQQAAVAYGVPLGVLYSVGLVESGRGNVLSPNAMNIEGRAYFATDRADGVRAFEAARGEGVRLIDIGCMQINHYYHGDKFASVAEMFDPKANVRYGARFLKELEAREGSWTMAVARYHAGPNNDPAQKSYVCKVIAKLVATGFGNWTPEARTFCDQP